MKKKRMNKKYNFLFLFFSLLFIVINMAWLTHHHILFGKFEKITRDSSVPGVYISPKDGLTFSVSKNKYLSFGGNLGISDPKEGIYLIIWPHIFKDYEFGFMIMNDNGTYNFVVDESGELQNGDLFTDEAIEFFKLNSGKLFFLIDEYEQWKEAAEKGDKSFFYY